MENTKCLVESLDIPLITIGFIYVTSKGFPSVTISEVERTDLTALSQQFPSSYSPETEQQGLPTRVCVGEVCIQRRQLVLFW